jgi:DNA helicase-2/ATP-dependent DNA helicase PcrA
LFPNDANLSELLAYLKADTDGEQARIVGSVYARLGITPPESGAIGGDQVKLLTMHGAKGLQAKVVFIPGIEQAIIPGRRALRAAGLLQEQRRLLYVSVTRAKAACILSLARRRTGASAQTLAQQFSYNSPPSLFVTELGRSVINKTGGLSNQEALSIAADCANLDP